ncbi:MAG: hypothetical protein IPL11_16700 [Candidatus Accumulibacter sp.]|nr:hypothetical protein [Accumulibacter sp.]
MHKLALFRLVFVTSRGLRERLTPAGLVIVARSRPCRGFGLDTQANLAHLLFSLGAAVARTLPAPGCCAGERHAWRCAAICPSS